MYQIMLFLHILGVLFMFAAVGITLAGMAGMVSSKDNKSLAIWSRITTKADEFLPFSVILILLPALHLVFTTWGWKVAWVNVSLIALLFMTIAGPIINLKRFKAIKAAVEAETSDTPSNEVLSKVRDMILWRSVSIMSVEVLGIVYLMSVKPKLIESILVIVIAFVIGLILANFSLKKSLKKAKNKQMVQSV